MKSNDSGRVLVIGDDMRIFLSVVRAFGRAGKIVHAAPFDMRSPALKSKFIAKTHAFPDYARDPSGWQKAVSTVLRQFSFDLIIPCADPAIIALDAHRQAFSGQNVAIPKAGAMSELFDKEMTHRMCEKLEIPVSRSALLGRTDTSGNLTSAFGLPLVIKPRRSFWADRLEVSGKVEIVESQLQLQSVLETLEDRSRYLVEAYFEGAGVGVSVLANDGEILQAFQHRRLREGKGGCSSYRISEEVGVDLRGACEKICRHTAHTGVCMFEFRCNLGTGQWVLLETNARFWGSMPLPLSLGVDFPNLLYDLLVSQKMHPQAPYEIGVRSRNFMLDGYNLAKQLRELRLSNLAMWLADVGDYSLQPLRWLIGSERSDSFVWDDLGPAFWEFALLPAALKQKVAAG